MIECGSDKYIIILRSLVYSLQSVYRKCRRKEQEDRKLCIALVYFKQRTVIKTSLNHTNELLKNWSFALFSERIFSSSTCRAWACLWNLQAYSTRLWCYSAVYYSVVGGKQSCWIGLYKSEPEAWDNVTYWLDGNPSTYRNWDSGKPDAVDQCVLIHNGVSRDLPCSLSRRYVCKGIYFVLKVTFRWCSVWFNHQVTLSWLSVIITVQQHYSCIGPTACSLCVES